MMSKREKITMDDIELIELKYLVQGYIREQYQKYVMDDVMDIIYQKFDLLPKFEGTYKNTVGPSYPLPVASANIRQVKHGYPGLLATIDIEGYMRMMVIRMDIFPGFIIAQ